MIDLMKIAPLGRFASGQLVDQHNVRNEKVLRWNGRPDDKQGFIRPIANAFCEDGKKHKGVQMHPMWVDNSTIKAWLPWRRLPKNARFKAQIGFLQGARKTDGVSFQVWVHHKNAQGKTVWKRVFSRRKKFDGKLSAVEVDLSISLDSLRALS